MRNAPSVRLASIVLLVLSACTEPGVGPDGDGDSADELGPATLPDCASPLMRSIFSAVDKPEVHANGTVPPAAIATGANRVDPMMMIDGPTIFPAIRDLIASAEHEVLLQFYVWERDSDPVRSILDGLLQLQERRRAAGASEPVMVHLIQDASGLGFGSKLVEIPRIWKQVAGLKLDPTLVQFDLAVFFHLAFGNLHVKSVVVDGRAAILTGANPQAHHDFEEPWRDAGFRFEGDVVRSLVADFDSALAKSHIWTCKGSEDHEFQRCIKKPKPLTHVLAPSTVSPDVCKPMLIASRRADGKLGGNRIDNPQDQAFLAAFGAAESHIRIQTPNLNDDAAIRAVVDAVARGVSVDIILSKNFNDGSENLPGQGGTNEENVERLHEDLAAAGVTDPCDRLHLHWYSFDGTSPVEGNGVRASHVKYATIDDQIAIVGTANMDTVSWNSSREVNIVVDDPVITQGWDEQLFLPGLARSIPVADGCQNP